MSIGGARHPVPRLHNEVFEGGDVFLLCTDGLYGPVSEPALTEILTASADVSSITEQLLGAALRAGAPDNVTAVVLRYREPE
jgi:protein phosphatase